jgi:GH15 family glucan-1,4-alpha-glucosidase
MSQRIEDYALIGNLRTAALVGKDGAINWLCAPRFDSAALFAGLLGDDTNGTWRIAPQGGGVTSTRKYRGNTLVLETEFETPDGHARVIDCMPLHGDSIEIVRVVEGVGGRVTMEMEFVPRFDYGHLIPSVGKVDGAVFAVAGPDGVCLRTPVEMSLNGASASARFTVEAGQSVPFHLAWHPSHEEPPAAGDPFEMVSTTEDWWQEWASQCQYDGPFRDDALRSLITLKALTYQPTGAIVAAPTTSLPEELGGERNWDYRFCWLRDGSFTLAPLVRAGYKEEAIAWRDWLLRAIAGDPRQLQLMYGIGGEHRLTELELPWLAGFEGSRPVRTGNAAAEQFQLDVYGEVLAVLYNAWNLGILTPQDAAAPPGVKLPQIIELVEAQWREPDEGIWEVRGQRQHFTYSKVSAWTAMDRAVKVAEKVGLDVPLDRWRATRDEIHAEVLARGFDTEKNSFVQHYGAKTLDASLLLIPVSGFLPATDPRVVGTIEAIQREICTGPFVWRYSTEEGMDGLAGGEGAFLICSFWLVAALAMMGRVDEAIGNMRKLVELRNDVGLLSEEYDPATERVLGNFPQAFSHIGLLHALMTIVDAREQQRAAA